MTVWLLALLVGAALVLIAIAVTVRRRAVAREARRVQALGLLSERLEASIAQLRPPRIHPVEPTARSPGALPPLVADRLPGRAALLGSVAEDLERVRGDAARLTVVLVRIAGATTSEGLVDAVRDVTGQQVYAVGPSAAAFTLPGHGRADGLAAIARIESRTAVAGRAVEWQPDETAVELVARLLEEPAAND